jgi:hypothetical protein
LGHELSAAGVRPLYSHVEALQAYPRPSTVKQLQAFLGLVNFYRRFVPAAARLLKPLTDALVGGARAAAPVVWTDSMQSAFLGAKSAVAAATCLAHPVVGARLGLMVDASATHVGAALQQKPSPSPPWQPLGFFSKKLDTAQMKYSAFDREMFACYAGIRHFRYILEGRPFTIFTDHKPLTYAVGRTSDPWTARQCRQLSYIAEFTSDIQHVAGVDNPVADALSRPPEPVAVLVPAVAAVPATAGTVDFAAIAAHQPLCTETQRTLASSSLHIKKSVVAGVPLLCDVSR